MRKFLFLLFVFFIQFISAQPDSLFFKKKIKDEFPKWIQKSKINLDICEVAFVNWNAGGSNSISALLGLAHESNYKFRHFYWNNNFVARYGINKQKSQELRKTEDLVEINSNLGYQKDSLTNWFYTSRFNFKTQLANGYSYPNTTKPISKFMAPGYLFFGGGIEYGKNIKKFSLYFSPLTLKSTFVLDQKLANDGAFGVTAAVLDDEDNIIQEGERVRNEFGILITNAYETEVLKNISMTHFVSFYTDYLNDFGNVCPAPSGPRVLQGHAAPHRARPSVDQRPRAPHPRRAHNRSRPHRHAPGEGPHPRARTAGQDRHPFLAPPRGCRGRRRSHGHPLRRQDPRRGHLRRAPRRPITHHHRGRRPRRGHDHRDRPDHPRAHRGDEVHPLSPRAATEARGALPGDRREGADRAPRNLGRPGGRADRRVLARRCRVHKVRRRVDRIARHNRRRTACRSAQA